MPYRTAAQIVEQIKAKRQSLGLSQVAAAKLAGVTNVYWCYVEREKMPPPEMATLAKMAAVVGLRLGEVKIMIEET